jgi:hypothetical protein
VRKKVLYPNISAELARIGCSIPILADYMGMTTTNLYNKLKGKTTINEKDMKKIQEFFIAKGGGAFTLDYLFSNGE